MPVIQITLIKGYDDATRQSLCKRLTAAALSVIAAPIDGVTVFINEVQASSYMRGGVARIPGKPLPSAAELVQSYLTAMDARDLHKAAQYLADNFSMTFPGAEKFASLEQMVRWSTTRYQQISKQIDQLEECQTDDGLVVYCHGRLNGVWKDGSNFSDVRFIDRFVVANGLLQSQSVWNDLGEVMAKRC